MEWEASVERMAKLRASIHPVRTDVPLRQVLGEDYPRECANLPIKGGWGYTQAEAIVFVREQFPRPAVPDFVPLEYLIAQRIIYEELIVFRSKEDRFSGIKMAPALQNMLTVEERKYDRLEFAVTCWSDWHWEQLKREWEENDFGMRPGFDREAHSAKRDASQVRYEREFGSTLPTCSINHSGEFSRRPSGRSPQGRGVGEPLALLLPRPPRTLSAPPAV
jgi:hypothetical protein